MNMRRAPKAIALDDEVQANVARIVAAWGEARERFGAGGPFLYGAFSAADAMYAPVVNRFHGYAIPVPPETRAYMDAPTARPARWRAPSSIEPRRSSRGEAEISAAV